MVRNGSIPAGEDYRWIFNLVTGYAGSTGRLNPRPKVAGRIGRRNQEAVSNFIRIPSMSTSFAS
jgi:hypothetical protein